MLADIGRGLPLQWWQWPIRGLVFRCNPLLSGIARHGNGCGEYNRRGLGRGCSLCDDVDDLNGEDCQDDDKRARPKEERAARAIETAEADRVFHGIKNRG